MHRIKSLPTQKFLHNLLTSYTTEQLTAINSLVSTTITFRGIPLKLTWIDIEAFSSVGGMIRQLDKFQQKTGLVYYINFHQGNDKPIIERIAIELV
jgi:hypothetical protein